MDIDPIEWCLRRNLTKRQLADLLGVSEQTIWNWTKGKSAPAEESVLPLRRYEDGELCIVRWYEGRRQQVRFEPISKFEELFNSGHDVQCTGAAPLDDGAAVGDLAGLLSDQELVEIVGSRPAVLQLLAKKFSLGLTGTGPVGYGADMPSTSVSERYPGEVAKQQKVYIYPTLKTKAQEVAKARGISLNELVQLGLEWQVDRTAGANEEGSQSGLDSG